MLIPSYAELMDVLNKESNENDEITSRYTIVIATAKRARQLIEGDAPMVNAKKGKPVSTAVDEIYKNKIKVVPEGEGTILNFNQPIEENNCEKPKSNEIDIDLKEILNFKPLEKKEEEKAIENQNAFDIDMD